MGETIRIQSAAGDTDTYLAVARPSPGPPVLLLHTWWGLNDVIRTLADRLAADGFTVMAPDLFDGRVYTVIEDAAANADAIEGRAEGNAGGLSPDRIEGRVRDALAHLLAHPDARGDRAAIVSLSFGAWYGNEVAKQSDDVAALVNFYGGEFEPPDGLPYLAHFAEDDQFGDADELAKLAATHADAVNIYPGTRHWFFEADRRSVTREGIEAVMAAFLSGCGKTELVSRVEPAHDAARVVSRALADAECEEAMADHGSSTD